MGSITNPSPKYQIFLDRASAKCALCGNQCPVPVWAISGASGSPDLDLRPSFPVRSTMSAWVSECRHCGYVAETIGTATASARQTIRAPAYQQHFEGSSFPILASKFLREMRIKWESPCEAIQALMCAIWACDDAGDAARADDLRQECAERLSEEIDALKGIQKTFFQLQRIDVLRRSRDFERAHRSAGIYLENRRLHKSVRAVLKFQRERCEDAEVKAYTVSDVVGETRDLCPVFYSGQPSVCGERARQFPRFGR